MECLEEDDDDQVKKKKEFVGPGGGNLDGGDKSGLVNSLGGRSDYDLDKTLTMKSNKTSNLSNNSTTKICDDDDLPKDFYKDEVKIDDEDDDDKTLGECVIVLVREGGRLESE